MRLILQNSAVIASIICYDLPMARAQQSTIITNDVFNTVLCAGFQIRYTQVDPGCTAWKGDINIANDAGHLINRHHNITCTNLLSSLPTIERGGLIQVKKYITLINDNEKIQETAYKRCDANTAAKAKFNELSAFDQIDKIVAGVSVPKPEKVTADNRDALIEKSPYSEKVKDFAKAANLLSDPETRENVRAYAADLASDPEYTVVYSASQAAEAPFSKILDAKDFSNKMDPSYNGPTAQEKTISNLADAVPKYVTNYITTNF